MVSFKRLTEDEMKAYSVDDNEQSNKFRIRSNDFVRIAGIIGALAVVFGAFGNHVLDPNKEISDERKKVFAIGNFYHFVHALALLGIPLTNKPTVVGLFFLTGISIFCGSCYITGITGNEGIAKITPYGGIAFILGWLCMLL
ncbi:transmembrane protein 256-like [Centruroides sculpturatus]|uniref:transmembrane protein 256-like n=1 Tax=Centruroides sculpturatus TaxID=218467 RepID=UPI000C6EED26|nr:transmembrane protein 256-like [Centruroides sculpturatus]